MIENATASEEKARKKIAIKWNLLGKASHFKRVPNLFKSLIIYFDNSSSVISLPSYTLKIKSRKE